MVRGQTALYCCLAFLLISYVVAPYAYLARLRTSANSILDKIFVNQNQLSPCLLPVFTAFNLAVAVVY